MKAIKFLVLTAITMIVVVIASHGQETVIALPPQEDIPEEILRTEIIIAARSPIDGEPLTAAEYAELEAKLQEAPPRKLDPKVRETVFLLNLRKALLQLFPFLDF